jgi:hypothetical protein
LYIKNESNTVVIMHIRLPKVELYSQQLIIVIELLVYEFIFISASTQNKVIPVFLIHTNSISSLIIFLSPKRLKGQRNMPTYG